MKKTLEEKIEKVIKEHEKIQRVKITYVKVDRVRPVGFKSKDEFKIDYGTE